MTEITTEIVRRWYATWLTATCETYVIPEYLAEFDRWLAEVTKEAYLDGLRDGIVAARCIADHSRVIPSPPTGPTMPAAGPTLAQDGLSGPEGTSGRDVDHEALQWPTSLWAQGLYRSTEETD